MGKSSIHAIFVCYKALNKFDLNFVVMVLSWFFFVIVLTPPVDQVSHR